MSNKTILVVDDSKTIRNLVAFILKAEGMQVETAENGIDGLEKLYSMPQSYFDRYQYAKNGWFFFYCGSA